MDKPNSIQVIHNLYALMMEINLYKNDEEILLELTEKSDPQIDNHLLKIRQLTTKLKAGMYRSRMQQAIDQIKVLRKMGEDELAKFLDMDEQRTLAPLFNKFKKLTSDDEKTLLQDKEVLQALEVLKKKIDESSTN